MMSLRKIFLAPLLLKKPPIFTKCLCTCHRLYANNFADDSKSFPIENRNEDKLTAELNLNALNILKNNKPLSDGLYLFLTLKKLCKKTFFYQEDGRDIWADANVKELCSAIDLNVSKLSMSESVKCLDLFRQMKAPGSMKVVQSLYKRINDSIKDLELTDFQVLSSALKQMPETALAKDLSRTLEQNFIIKVATEYDPRNSIHIEKALCFTIYNLDNNKLLTMFIDDLNNYKGEISTRSVINIFKVLNLMKQHSPSSLDLLQKIEQILIERVHKLNTSQIQFVLFLMGEKFRIPQNQVYNEMLCDLLVKKIIADDSGFEAAVSAVYNFNHMRHVNIDLLNYTSATFFEKINLSNEVIQHDIFKLTTLISALSLAKHKTVFFNEIKDCLLNNKSLLRCDHKMLCILGLNLISLDCYPIELLTKVFDGMGNYGGQGEFLHWTFCKTYQKLKTNPMYKGPLPTESQMTELKKFHQDALFRRKTSHDRILFYLEEGMGSPIYVKSNISSKLFHIIDYVVAFSKDGSPIQINTDIDGKFDSIEYIEDFKVPPGSQIVLILLMNHFWYTSNTKELMSLYSCSRETLESALSYPVVCINKGTFNEIPDKEKTVMLMSKIRSKLVHN